MRDVTGDSSDAGNGSDGDAPAPNDGASVHPGQPSGSTAGEDAAPGGGGPRAHKADEGQEPGQEVERDSVDVVEAILEDVPEEKREAVRGIMLASRYSGALPPPDMYRKYPEDTQERILRMAEAFTTDESARQTKLVDAEISEARQAPRRTFVLFSACLALAAVIVMVSNNTLAASLFLGVPVIMYFTSQISPVHSKSSRSKEVETGED